MIDSMWMLTLAGSLLAAVVMILMAVLAWIGNKLYVKLEEIVRSLNEIAGDLHKRINVHDTRITRLETKNEVREKK